MINQVAQVFSQFFSSQPMDQGAPKRFSNQLAQWVGHFSRNAAVRWTPNLIDPTLCSFCDEDAVTDCIVCKDPVCIAHAHISHRAEAICDACVQEVLDAKQSKQRPRRKRSAHAPPPPAQGGGDPELQQALAALGVTETDSWETVTAAFKAAAIANHPDKFSGEQKALAERRMMTINQAYETLKRRRR